MSSLKQRILGIVCKYRGHDIRLLRHFTLETVRRTEEAACRRCGEGFYYRFGLAGPGRRREAP